MLFVFGIDAHPVQILVAFLRPVRHQNGSTGRYSSRRLDDIFPPDVSAYGFTCRSRHTKRGTSDMVSFPAYRHTAMQPPQSPSMPCILRVGLGDTNFVNLNVNGTRGNSTPRPEPLIHLVPVEGPRDVHARVPHSIHRYKKKGDPFRMHFAPKPSCALCGYCFAWVI